MTGQIKDLLIKEEEVDLPQWRFRLAGTTTILFGYGKTAEEAKKSLPSGLVGQLHVQLIDGGKVASQGEKYLDEEGRVAYRS